MSDSPYRLATRLSGVYLISVSSLGIYFNVSVFVHFVSLDRSSFHLMCISKCISNFLALFIYFAYIGPTCLLYQYLLSDFWDKYLNQAIAYGFFLQGSVTQLLITVNRFLVVFSNSVTSPRYSTQITVGLLAVCWLITLYCSLLIGFPDQCLTRFTLQPVGWKSDRCVRGLYQWYFIATVSFGVFSNCLNLLIAVKLIISSKSSALSSDTARSRRKRTIRFFLQSVCQDWLYSTELTVGWAFAHWIVAEDPIVVFVSTMGCDMMVDVVDGLIMFVFNYQKTSARKKTGKTISVTSKV